MEIVLNNDNLDDFSRLTWDLDKIEQCLMGKFNDSCHVEFRTISDKLILLDLYTADNVVSTNVLLTNDYTVYVGRLNKIV